MPLQDLLKDKLPEEKIHIIQKGFEVIGDIVIVNIPSSLEDEKYLIAVALAIHRKDIKVVLRKIDKIHGDARVGSFELLLGERTTTLHRENNCIYHVDVAKAYFSSRLGYERNRIAQKVEDGENVLVVFCGVGPFLIPIKKKRDVDITGLDNNKNACTFLKENIALNNVEADIILGDANLLNNIFKKSFDRIVMPTPYGQDYFLNLAKAILKPRGIVHFYTFKKTLKYLILKDRLKRTGGLNFIEIAAMLRRG